MKASEIEELVQQITGSYLSATPKAYPCSCFFAREKEFLPNYIPSFPLFSGEPVKIKSRLE